jgi:dynactin-6
MSSSKRQSVLPPSPKPPTTFSPHVVISEQSSFIGTKTISIGPSTVVHPRAKLNSSYASIKIGSNCIISERSSVGLQSATSEDQSEGVVIENGVIVEAGASVEARTIREGSVVEINARVGKGAVIGKV